MRKIMKNIAFILISICSLLRISHAQQLDSLTLDTLHDAEIRLTGLGEQMIKAEKEDDRFTSAYMFLRTMSRALKTQNSFAYNFDSLKCVSIIHAPDNLFRIITWNLVTKEEKFHYYGVIQMNPEMFKKVKDTSNLRLFYPLIDRSSKIKNPLDTIVDNEYWYGATYYKIILNNYKKNNYYTLLGWNGSNKMTNKKLVDVLHFEKNKPYFGAPIFDLKKKKKYSRLVFEFSNSASMLLRYEPKKKILVYENVSPTRVQDYGHPETYLPDGSYDFLLFKNGIWEKQQGMLKDFNME
jgi:hypothetical protein